MTATKHPHQARAAPSLKPPSPSNTEMNLLTQQNSEPPAKNANGVATSPSTAGPISGIVAAYGDPPSGSSSHGGGGFWQCCIAALTVALLFATGCATSHSGSQTTRPGDGLREYQRLVLDLRKDVTLTRQALETLTAATQKNSAAAYARFDDSLQRLEVVSIKARARADAMEKRGEAYFEEWGEEISASGNEASRELARERFAELRLHLDAVLKDSRQVRQEFRRFLDGLRELRTKLGQSPTPAAIEQVRPALAQAASDGRQAEEAMNQLLSTLKTAETAVMSGPAPAPKAGGGKS